MLVLVYPVTASVVIDRPREQVFEYLLDIANHSEFTDHYLKDFRLNRHESHGLGPARRCRAGAGRKQIRYAPRSRAMPRQDQR